jgi:hypothetical protein
MNWQILRKLILIKDLPVLSNEIGHMALSENWSQLLSDKIPRKELDQFSRTELQR